MCRHENCILHVREKMIVFIFLPCALLKFVDRDPIYIMVHTRDMMGLKSYSQGMSTGQHIRDGKTHQRQEKQWIVLGNVKNIGKKIIAYHDNSMWPCGRLNVLRIKTQGEMWSKNLEQNLFIFQYTQARYITASPKILENTVNTWTISMDVPTDFYLSIKFS